MGNEFRKEIMSLRTTLSEHGLEITLEDLLDVLERALNEKEMRNCPMCLSARLSVCFPCLAEMVRLR